MALEANGVQIPRALRVDQDAYHEDRLVEVGVEYRCRGELRMIVRESQYELPADARIIRHRKCRQCKKNTMQGWLADKRVWFCTGCGKEKA